MDTTNNTTPPDNFDDDNNINPDNNNNNINNINQNHNNNNRDQFLRHLTHLNKLSHKISKPTRPTNATASASASATSLPEPPVGHPQQQQPPVYNINKSDFRDVVQKLTGSPAHALSSSVPAIHAPHHKPATSSRLQRIRPPPLAQLTARPPPLLSGGSQSNHPPLSPLPPFPTCHAAAESPISAYMRFLHNQTAGMMFPPPENMENVPPPTTAGESSSSGFPPSSPLPFGCLPSPKSPCPLLSPNLLLPLSPTVPSVPSPKWRD